MTDLDASTIEEIAAFLTSSEAPRYLSEAKLREFLRRAGIEEIPEAGTMTRRDLARQALTSGNSNGNINAERVILRLADPREYPNNKATYEETLRELGEILASEGLTITHDERGRPAITALATQQRVDGLRGIKLNVSLGQVIRDPALAAVAQERLDEADRCQAGGAYMASIIMLGSLLEGVLVAAAQERPHRPLRGNPPIRNVGLQALINLAHEERWIQFDAHLVSDLVRQYRNLVHPLMQLAIGHYPDADTLDMCQSVVNAILNDLAATCQQPSSGSSTQARNE